MNIEQLPTKGQRYGSGEAITELNEIVDEAMEYDAPRCDCDSSTRCRWCMLEQEIRTRKELIKGNIQRLIDLIENTSNSKKKKEEK